MLPVDRTFTKAVQNNKPPENLTVSQWAEKYRILSRESAAEAGPWRNSRTPYMVEVMDAFDDPRVHDIAVVAMSQTGKSELELNTIGKIIHQDPAPILYVQPDLGEAKKFSTVRIAPMIRDCPVLRSRVADIKSRDSKNTILQKSFPGGMLTMVGSQTASALASIPVRYVIGDEIDRWALSAGTEGDPWELAEKRTTTFYNAKRIAVSTPTIKGFSRIEKLYFDGTQEKWYTQCPDCEEWNEVIFDDIKIDFEASKGKRGKASYKLNSVHWCCPSCGCIHTEQETRTYPCKWVAENPEAINRGRRSFWVNAFFSPWRSWDEIALKFLEVHKDPEQFKVFYNTVLGQLWEDRGDLEDEDTMLARRESYGSHPDGTPVELPDGVLVLTCGVDTQDDRLEYEVVGHGHYGENWGIKKGVILGDPNDDEVWLRLDDVIDHVYRRSDGRGLTISLTFVDSGGHKTQSVYKHCRDRVHKRVFAIKGVGGDGVPFTRPPSKVKIVVNGRTIGQTWLYSLGVDAGKADIMGALKVQEPGPKYCHFPRDEGRGYDLAFFNGLLSEKLVLKSERGRTRWTWVKLQGHERNEALDCRNYALAALRVLDPDMDAVEARLREAKKADASPNVKTAYPTSRARRKVTHREASRDDW